MTNDQITDKWLSLIGLRREKGHSLEAILPFLMLDVNYSIYQSTVRPIECKRDMKMWKKRWIKSYNRINRSFFRAFSDDEQDVVIGIMDDFSNYISNDVMIARVQVMNILKDIELEHQKVCSDLVIANVLAQSAQVVWNKCYRRNNCDISAVMFASSRFMSLYHSSISREYVNPNNSKQIVDAVEALCNKMVLYLHKTLDSEY